SHRERSPRATGSRCRGPPPTPRYRCSSGCPGRDRETLSLRTEMVRGNAYEAKTCASRFVRYPASPMADSTSRAEGTGALRAALVELVARSATFEERAAGEWVVSEPSPEHEGGAICSAVGIPPSALQVRGPIAASLARARVRDPGVLPGWARALEHLLDDPRPAALDDDVPGADEAGDARDFATAFSGFV